MSRRTCSPDSAASGRAGDGRQSLGIVFSSSVEQTRVLGRGLGKLLQPGDFIGLKGDLGAGKTELVRGIAEGAGVPPAEVTSPTFALVNVYGGRLKIIHADLFRLKTTEELYSIGWEDFLQQDAACVVEWLTQVAGAAPAELLQITMEDLGQTERRLTVVAHGARANFLLRACF